jgi:predicted permease
MERLLIDIRSAIRLFRLSPGLAVAATGAMTLGIGFTTTMFGIVHGSMRGLPVPEGDAIFAIAESTSTSGDAAPSSAASFNGWSARLTTAEALGAFRAGALNLSGDRLAPARIDAAEVTPNAFGILRVPPVIGRTMADADAAPGAPRIVLIGEALWRSRFAADRAIVGGPIRLDGEPHTVVGVMPEGFGFPINAAIWRPLHVDPAARPDAPADITVFGRLRPGGRLEDVNRELATIPPVSGADGSTRRSARGVPFAELETPAEIQRALQFLIAVVSLALLVACANVANLLLARAAARTRDTAIRTALGASRARLVRQHMLEVLVMAGVASVAGLGLTSIALRAFGAASAGVLEAFWVDFRIDAGVALFAAGLGSAAALAAGLVPALRASRGGVSVLLKNQAGSVTGLRIGRLGRSLVAVQVCLACGLLIVTATFLRASASLRAVDNPFPAHEILTAQVGLPPSLLGDPAARSAIVRRIAEGLAAEPDLGSHALVSVLPGRGTGRWSFTLPDSADAATTRTSSLMLVTPGLFDLAGATALRGRLLTWADAESAPPVAVVNQSFAARFMPGSDPVGQRIRLGSRDLQVVGVVADLLMQDVDEADGAGFYLPMLQGRAFTVRVMARGRDGSSDTLGALRRAVAAASPDLPVMDAATLHDAIYADKQVLDALAWLFLCFGLGAVLLAVIGTHAVASFVVTARTREFGVRVALGADQRDLARLVIRGGAIELVTGLALGLVLAFAVSEILASALERLPAAGPAEFGALSAVVGAGSALALWRPLRRTARLDPAAALRAE